MSENNRKIIYRDKVFILPRLWLVYHITDDDIVDFFELNYYHTKEDCIDCLVDIAYDQYHQISFRIRCQNIHFVIKHKLRKMKIERLLNTL